MRTTLTLDDDVAAQIERLRRDRDANLKDVVNEALRRGLRDMTGPPRKRKPFRTQTYAMGSPRIDIDNVAEALANAEGDAFK
jgi:hypothetical protein